MVLIEQLARMGAVKRRIMRFVLTRPSSPFTGFLAAEVCDIQAREQGHD